MSDYTRLTDKKYLNKPKCFNCEHNYSNCVVCERYCADGDYFQLREELQRLVQLEDKIENGTLIDLPCKVGTIVYQIYKDCSKCSHFKETGWEYDCWCDFDSEESKTIFEFDGDNDCVYIIEETEFTYNHIKDFGKDIFLTKAEAEVKLKELKGEV